MNLEPSKGPLVAGASTPISGFSPIAFSLRLFGRDLRGALVPLLACAVVGNLDLLVQRWLGPFLKWPVGEAVMWAWFPIGSYCAANMLSLALRVARRQPYGFRDVWQYPPSLMRLMGLKLLLYAALTAASYVLFSLSELSTSLGNAVTVPIVSLLVLLAVFVAASCCIAPVVLVDGKEGPLRALAGSVQLTRGHATPIVVYGVVLSLVAGVLHSLGNWTARAGLALLVTLATPGVVYLYLALRGELTD
jgi:hypothetical protein